MSKGFTLIELLVAIMIVGILSAVAVSSYQDYTLRAQRADTKSVLMEAAGWMERYYTANGRYDQDTAGTAVALPADYSHAPKTGTPRYDISLAASNAPPGFTLTAALHAGWSDAECGTLSLNQQGVQTKSGTGTVADCWQR